jgi:hypothetical protein
MPLKVISLAQYLSGKVPKMRDADYLAISLVQAVKGKISKGRTQSVTFMGKKYEFGPGKTDDAVALWCAWSAPRVSQMVDGPIVLVPVPNSVAEFGKVETFRTVQLAERLASAIGPRASVVPQLWWREQMTPSHKGGPRFASQLYPFLIGVKDGRPGTRVLLDDVMTSGGHFQASAAKLRELGHDCTLAICCGRTQHAQLENPFVLPIEELSDFDPDDPHGFKSMFLTE